MSEGRCRLRARTAELLEISRSSEQLKCVELYSIARPSTEITTLLRPLGALGRVEQFRALSVEADLPVDLGKGRSRWPATVQPYTHSRRKSRSAWPPADLARRRSRRAMHGPRGLQNAVGVGLGEQLTQQLLTAQAAPISSVGVIFGQNPP